MKHFENGGGNEMSEARDELLKKIHNALKNVPSDEKPEDIQVPRDYRRRGKRSDNEIATQFAERVGEYKATVKKVTEKELVEVIAESCTREKVENLVVPDDFPNKWLPATVTPLFDNPSSPLSHQELDASDGVITTCALAIAQTGTVVLDAGEGQGRRVLTLIPDYHLCIVRENQIVELVPEGFSYFESLVKTEGRPITFISGPSATSDIELSRVEGVHGPRRLEVLIVNTKIS
jgi:L-lactate dehydrogenase complex protein LldG